MDEIDFQNTNDESTHHSLILRCWRDSLGELRGQLINPVTNKAFAFASISDMHQVLDHAINEISFTEAEKREEGEPEK